MALSGAGLHRDLAAVAQRSGNTGEAKADGKRSRFQARSQGCLYTPDQLGVCHHSPR